MRNSTLSLYPAPCIPQAEAEGQQVSLGTSSVEHCCPLHFSRSGGDRKLQEYLGFIVNIGMFFKTSFGQKQKHSWENSDVLHSAQLLTDGLS